MVDREEPRAETASGIVVGVDGSESCLRAAEWAAREAALRNEPLVIAHVHSWERHHESPKFDLLIQHEEELLRTATDRARAINADISIEAKSLDPTVMHGLVAESKDASMLVLGFTERGPVEGFLMGSATRQCLHHAYCTVVVVRKAE